MKQSTATEAEFAGECDVRPLDITIMRSTAQRTLALGEAPPLAEDLETLTSRLRGHIQLLLPEVRGLISAQPATDQPAMAARVGVEEAHRRLTTTKGFGPDAAYRHAARLARSVHALCDHYETLNPPIR
ncbi:DUF6415 family natural product biosynthesis protein [Streptomyces sp. NBC_01216]|uniref:DUF6415 family natural product biosynthesis protein n=1 Tax=Streptomyces sp. NBC_01216 TaxID=2903778 RepID=UPI002E107B64|nr:DUF6415 family natural product biosynthesis protein [Streptomyces sp. NBC_01216]